MKLLLGFGLWVWFTFTSGPILRALHALSNVVIISHTLQGHDESVNIYTCMAPYYLNSVKTFYRCLRQSFTCYAQSVHCLAAFLLKCIVLLRISLLEVLRLCSHIESIPLQSTLATILVSH